MHIYIKYAKTQCLALNSYNCHVNISGFHFAYVSDAHVQEVRSEHMASCDPDGKMFASIKKHAIHSHPSVSLILLHGVRSGENSCF